MADLNLRHAREQTRKAVARLDQALSGYGRDLTEHDGRGAIRSAYQATKAALEAIDHDIAVECERVEDALEEWAGRPDPDLYLKERKVEAERDGDHNPHLAPDHPHNTGDTVGVEEREQAWDDA